MVRSIRWRLQGWYAVVLLVVVAGFAGLFYYQVRTARFQEIDTGLAAAAQYLDAGLRRMPPVEIGGPPPPDRRPRPRGERPPPDRFGKGRGDGRGPPPFDDPPPPQREQLLDELTLPRRAASAEDGNSPGTYFAVWRIDGSLVKGNALPEGAAAAALAEPTPLTEPVISQRSELRETLLLGPWRTRILVGRSVRKEMAELHALALQLTAVGAAVLGVGLVGGWLVAGRILRPVGTITAAASAISATNLSERINPEAVDRELQNLAHVLNAAFDRLEGAFERQARFTADASHELRTPLAIIRSHAQLALGRERAADEYRKAIEACLHASDRMTALVEGLLTLARADAGKLDLRRRPVDFRRLTADTVALFRPLAEGQRLSLTARLEPAEVLGDADRLAQVVTNLLSNAVRYNHLGGSVGVCLDVLAGMATLTVADTGAGIPDEDRPHVFERFYRADKARSRASGGTGLGLAICRSIVAAHGGRISFTSAVGQGTTFLVRLPLAGSPEPDEVADADPCL